MFEVWIKRKGEQRYLPWVWCFEKADAEMFVRWMHEQGHYARFYFNCTCAMDDWKPPNDMRPYRPRFE